MPEIKVTFTCCNCGSSESEVFYDLDFTIADLREDLGFYLTPDGMEEICETCVRKEKDG